MIRWKEKGRKGGKERERLRKFNRIRTLKRIGRI